MTATLNIHRVKVKNGDFDLVLDGQVWCPELKVGSILEVRDAKRCTNCNQVLVDVGIELPKSIKAPKGWSGHFQGACICGQQYQSEGVLLPLDEHFIIIEDRSTVTIKDILGD